MISEYEEGWLCQQIENAKYSIELWPIYQQEYMCLVGSKFTLEEKIRRTRIRITRLEEEIEREREQLDIMIGELNG